MINMEGFFIALVAGSGSIRERKAPMATSTFDNSALRFNQMSIVILVVTGFILDLRVLPLIVGAILFVGSIAPRLSVFRWVYRSVIVPLKILTPQIVDDDGAAHRFAQLLGGLTLLAASVALFTGAAVTGWVLAWVVIALAGVNLLFGFCTGCFIYYRITKFTAGRSAEHSQEALPHADH